MKNLTIPVGLLLLLTAGALIVAGVYHASLVLIAIGAGIMITAGITLKK